MNEFTIILLVLLLAAAYGVYLVRVVRKDGLGDRQYRRHHPAPRSHHPAF